MHFQQRFYIIAKSDSKLLNGRVHNQEIQAVDKITKTSNFMKYLKQEQVLSVLNWPEWDIGPWAKNKSL